MHRAGRVAIVGPIVGLGLALSGARTPAAADPTQLGAYFGPRLYSDDSRLGYIEDAPAHPTLDNSIQLGARIGRPLFPWLVPELELAFAPTGTKPIAGAAAVDVFWLQPRVHLRFELLPDRRIQPFVLIGGGTPIALSSARMTYDSGITGEGYLGGGVRFDSRAGFIVRADARVGLHPGIVRYIAAEIDVSVGIELQLGKQPRRRIEQRPLDRALDRDLDGIADTKDGCPDRAEDADGFDDLDGCPDIDNDLDRVLDIADRCPAVIESYNGFQDEDGCPDSVPSEVDALRGTIEGLLYAEGETVVRDSAMANIATIARTMAAHPSIKVVLIGHTDDREANQFAEVIEGQPPPDLVALASDLARARAESVRQALVAAGVASPRVIVEARGAEEPVADNDKPKGRLANRRVEIRLFVPPR